MIILYNLKIKINAKILCQHKLVFKSLQYKYLECNVPILIHKNLLKVRSWIWIAAGEGWTLLIIKKFLNLLLCHHNLLNLQWQVCYIGFAFMKYYTWRTYFLFCKLYAWYNELSQRECMLSLHTLPFL